MMIVSVSPGRIVGLRHFLEVRRPPQYAQCFSIPWSDRRVEASASFAAAPVQGAVFQYPLVGS